ncbi:M6 family metalloprotease [Xylariomycetidae sp. FL0641]|nr:M6 family metalloprotease [Xylariomycetidae sp. FL0641]
MASIIIAGLSVMGFVHGAPYAAPGDPFAVLDPQNYVLPDNMTWADYVAPPNTNWSDPSVKGSNRNFNIALVVVDYPDETFVISKPANSTIFTNPQPVVSELSRDEIPAFYRDLLNTPSELNRGHTMHEYWMEDSGGRFGVDLTVFGAYELPSMSFQYGVDDGQGGFNPDACPEGYECPVDLRTDALGAWRADVGNETADAFELVFILSAGQDESSTWQEFGEMKFLDENSVPDSFGPPANSSLPNHAATRYVNWTSWASASTIWPNAGDGSSTQAESSGMATYAHELTHLLGVGDNYNNPYADPPVRSYTGPWSMLSRGSFGGPGGPHTRWQIPALRGGALGSPHTSVLNVSRAALAAAGPVVAELTARTVKPEGPGQRMGLHVQLTGGGDLAPACSQATDPLCDGGGYDNYDVEVIDRMGADSFSPDAGVMLSKTKDVDDAPFQWTVDANPQDIGIVDFYRPDGSPAYLSIGDYRQLADALFHAGTRSGSLFEYADVPNRLHFYILNTRRDSVGVLHYTVGVRSLDGGGAHARGVALGGGKVAGGSSSNSSATCAFALTNTGSYVAAGNSSLLLPTRYLHNDIYRLAATTDAHGWEVVLPNELATAGFGNGTAGVDVAVRRGGNATASAATVTLTAAAEAETGVRATATCVVKM